MRWRTIKPAVLTQPLVPTLYKTALARTNTALGYRSGAHIDTGDNNIDIGNEGVAGENGTIRIGSASQVRTFIAGISGSVVTGAIVQVNAAGQLGTAPSAARFKDDIKPMDKASEAILALKPVTFHYKQKIDPNRRRQRSGSLTPKVFHSLALSLKTWKR
jgi:hypothetical protein